MKVKYLAALAAVSVLSVGTLASCGPSEPEAAPDATEEAAPADDAMEEPAMEEPAMEEGAMEEPAAEPCAPE